MRRWQIFLAHSLVKHLMGPTLKVDLLWGALGVEKVVQLSPLVGLI